MAIDLSKGHGIDLNKEAPGIEEAIVTIEWKENRFDTGGKFDVDVTAAILDDNEQLISEKHFVYYKNLKDPEQAVIHLTGDNKTGGKEEIKVIPKKLHPNARYVRFAVSIHDGVELGQNFGLIRNATVSIKSGDGQELAFHNLSREYDSMTCMIPADLEKDGRTGDLTFRAVAQGYQNGFPAYVRSIGG